MAPPSSSHLFTPIQEGNESEERDERHRFESTTGCTDNSGNNPAGKNSTKSRRSSGNHADGGDRSVSCNNCRPSHRESTSVVVVPVENPSPNGLFKSLIGRKSPKHPPESSSSAAEAAEREEQWRIAVAELSHKLVQATRKRDEAVLEASRLKYSMTELEKKLNRLEIYCHNLKSGLDKTCRIQSPARNLPHVAQENHDLIVKNFLVWVAESRSSIRFLSKSLASQLKLMGIKVFEQLSTTLLQSFNIKLSSSNNIKSLQFYIEALLSATFFEDFESVGFSKNSTNRVLNPIERSESNYSDFNSLKDLCWEEVLSKGTKHYSEEFSGFCDRKMSEIVAMLGWNRAWPEQLLQAFFGASKSVWLVYLLANSVYPNLTIFRVDKGVRFDPVYMEDMVGDKAKRFVPAMVRIMVAPGFYVYDNVVKCKVLCRYSNNN